MQVASALNDLGRKPQAVDDFELELDEDFYSTPPVAGPSNSNSHYDPQDQPDPEQPATEDHPIRESADTETCETTVPCKRTAEQTTTDLELEDDAELDALAAKCALPSKKARLEPFQHFDATHSSSLSTAAPPKSASAATAHRFSALNVDLGVHVSPLQPVQAKTFEGHSLTFKRRRVQAQQTAQSTAATAFAKLGSTLIGTPLWKLKEEIAELDKRKQELADQEMAQALALSEANVENLEGHRPESQLWVDRYRPQKYADLLGDDRVHRDAMTWLKEWDACVFKTAAAQTAKKKAMQEKRKKAQSQANAGYGQQQQQLLEPEDPFGRPNEKIMLLSGPPGLGKTTLAHVLAKQAGYQVHEINASDDRSAKVVTDRIKNATESRAISSSGSMSSNKPTCIVIDEIDGASGATDTGFVRTLVKFIQDGTRVYKGKASQKKDTKPILRPIICICNDLYAPVLRPLRPLARLIRFSPVAPNALVGRMRNICTAEKLLADTKSLTALVSAADGDLRTCLNTLQFLKARKAQVNENTIRNATLGAKDTGTSPATVWNKLFKRAYDRKGKTNEDPGVYVEKLVKHISTCGEYDKIVQGCFEYYPNAKWPIDGWGTINNALSWLQFYDSVDYTMRSDRNFDLMPYLPYTQVAWHPLLAAVANKPIEFSKADYDAYQKRVAHQEIADAFVQKLTPLVKGSFNASTLVTELTPYLNRIVSPDVKMTGSTVTKPEERLIFDKLVQLMKTFGLSFVEDKNEDGQWSYKLEPAIDVFVHYDGKRASDIPPSKYSLRQLVASTMSEGQSSNVPRSTVDDLMSAYKKSVADISKAKPQAAAIDFFGRTKVVEPSANSEASETFTLNPSTKPAAKIVYRYREGFSNAVRTPVKINELFQMDRGKL